MTPKEDFAAFVREHLPSLQRAAELGYDVSSAVVDLVIARMPHPDRMWKQGAPDSADIGWQERDNPRPAALDFAATLPARLNVPHPQCMTITVGRVVRVTEPDKRWTAVPVFVKTPITGDRILFFSVES